MNKIPENWITYKISDLCDFQNGYAFNSSDYVEEGMPIIRMSNISIDGNLNLTSENTKYYPREKAAILKKYVLNKNDVVMAMTDMTKDMGIIGKTAIIDEDNKYLLNQRVGRLIIKNPKILDYKYLHRYTNSPRFLDYAKQHCSGGVQLNLSTKAILNHKIILPSTIKEQEEIAQVLDTMSDIIRLREECISHVQALIPALFQEMFPLVNNTNYSVNELVNLNVIEKPMDGNHGEIHPKASDYISSGIPFIMASDLSNSSVDTTHCNYISKEKAQKLRKGFAKSGDVLLSHKGTIGRTAIVQPLDVEYIILTPQVTYYRILNNKIINNHYLKSYFDTSYFQSILQAKASKGATRAYIGITEQLSLPVYLPDIEIQEQFAQKVIEIENYIKEQQEELESAKQMFQSLLHHAFTGELTRHKFGGDANG